MPVEVADADTISVLEVLNKLESEFAAVATAFENGEFALWVGSGISRKAPNLGGLISRAIEFLRVRSMDPKYSDQFKPALERVLRLAGIHATGEEAWFPLPFSSWPNQASIIATLWTKYSDLLDERIQGEPPDYMLWEAVDVRAAFKDPNPPACEHLCIAVLILEGALQEIVSANWDGFIEAAVQQIAGSISGNLQVIVDPDHLRDAPGKARLLKFHGCIVHATENPQQYRGRLIASKTQILGWPDEPLMAAMRDATISAATNRKAIMVGLSLQDVNIQSVFVKARQANPWPWPCTPHAQAHVFCENEIGSGHRQMLKTVYNDTYNDHIDDIERGAHLRAWGEQVLLALVLKLITDKLVVLLEESLRTRPLATNTHELVTSLKLARDHVAGFATANRTQFLTEAITTWSRMISIFRMGTLPAHPNIYEPISGTSLKQLVSDSNAIAASFGELAVALSLLSFGQSAGHWMLGRPSDQSLTAGSISSTGTWDGAQARPIFLVRTASIALDLQRRGAFDTDNTIVIHADDAWHRLQPSNSLTARSPSRPPGRTGNPRTHHISIPQIVAGEADVARVRRRFIEEAIP